MAISVSNQLSRVWCFHIDTLTVNGSHANGQLVMEAISDTLFGGYYSMIWAGSDMGKEERVRKRLALTRQWLEAAMEPVINAISKDCSAIQALTGNWDRCSGLSRR